LESLFRTRDQRCGAKIVETVLVIVAFVSLLIIMLLIGKARRMRKDIRYLNSVKDFQQSNGDGHQPSQADWERAAEHSRKVSRDRHYG